jgi:choline dehydrogenase-like flavoprotein
MVKRARLQRETPFDYIIVGSGAAGGPLAARLAENGKTVLLLEAGIDPVDDADIGHQAPFTGERTRQTYEVPAFHGASTEDKRMSWGFSVRHFASLADQKRDSKYDASKDPEARQEKGKGGIFYPRASGVGGCTTHHAMIVVRPNDSDWNRIAEITEDPSWRAENMQGYFARIENCLYYDKFEGAFGKLLFLYKWGKRLLTWINPKAQLSRGGHGRHGWQDTSFIDPALIWRITKGDKTFRRILLRVILFLLTRKQGLRRLGMFLKTLRIVQLLDPNYGTARSGLSAQLSFIPIGTDGHQRVGVRERLLSVAMAHPLRLVIKKQTLVKRVLFNEVKDDVPHAIGVEFAEGYPLYEATGAKPPADPDHDPPKCYFAREEVILAGGSFNTPQLLMLSGIGDAAELARAGVKGIHDRDRAKIQDVVDLPGVGRNLQDRYEVGIVSQTQNEFTTLKDVSFEPLDGKDPALAQWNDGVSGLYSTNGGAVSFFYKTKAHDRTKSIDPDLFIFGAPAAFRGYYWKWSTQLLFKTKDADVKQRDLWTWLILKAYTKNNQGRVTLRDGNPFRQPEICFNSFPASAGSARDLESLREGVEFVRSLNATVPQFKEEVQPGKNTGPDELEAWIRKEAWGHHACGTCRIGSDPWRSDVKRLDDTFAVVDARFRVHGVKNLRVVDASVFPEIPGYFIVTPIFMIAEKAADDLLATRAHQTYPAKLQEREAIAVRVRRALNTRMQPTSTEVADAKLPDDTVGLALSGGGIRSATLCLGVLQALAQRGRIKAVDMLATVSGGGYIGSFLGRMFTRVPFNSIRPGERVEKVVGDVNSAENRWLREHANYISGGGRSDNEVNLGVIWRNLLGSHMSLASMFIAVFAFLRWLTDNTALDFAGSQVFGLEVSPWWWVPVSVFVFGIYPGWLAYWLAQKPGAAKPHPVFGLFAWLIMLGAAVAALRLQKAELLATIGITSLLVAWLWQELARIRAIKPDGREEDRGVIIRNRLTRGLGLMLAAFAFTTLWVVLDSLARLGAQDKLMFPLVGAMGVLATVMPLLRDAAARFSKGPKTPGASTRARNFVAGAIAFPLLTLLLFSYDVIAHTSFEAGEHVGQWTLLLALLIALVLSRAHGFLNLTSLNGHYASRLARTFLGASTEARVHANPSESPPEVGTAHPDDDTFFERYHPEQHGGPLHLMSVCVNETVDAMSGRAVDEDKGLTMCVGPAGVSVGRRFHALWEDKNPGIAMLSQQLISSMEQSSDDAPALCPLPVSPDPNAFHVLSRDPMRDREICVVPERLRLSQWMAISGAAFTPGQGRHTSLPMSLLLGLFNVRLGYWWDSGVEAGSRPGRYPPSFLRRLGSIPSTIFRAQATLLSEWYRHFKGPGHRVWYLSDGGHIENSALYELMRRRVRFMIMVDGTHDPRYVFDDLAALVRRARLDFDAHVEWLDPAKLPPLPAVVTDWIDTSALGTIESLKREGKHAAALACVTYGGDPGNKRWLLVLKGCLVPEEMTLDLRCYSTLNEDFPNTPTADQFLDGDQWESYRLLGQQTARRIFKQAPP